MTWNHPTMTREQFEARLRELAAEEAKEPERWWWLSFARPGEFLGVAIVRARGGVGAVAKTKQLGQNPGGEVQFHPLNDDLVEQKLPVAYRNRLLTKEQLEELHLI